MWPDDSPAGTAFGAVRGKVLCGQRVLRKLPRWVTGAKGKTPPRKGPCAGTLRSQESLGEPGAQTRDLTGDTHQAAVCRPPTEYRKPHGSKSGDLSLWTILTPTTFSRKRDGKRREVKQLRCGGSDDWLKPKARSHPVSEEGIQGNK